VEAVDGEVARGGEEEGRGFFDRLAVFGVVDAEVGVVRNILSFVGISEEPREIAAQRSECGAVETRELRLAWLVICHDDGRWHSGRGGAVQRRFCARVGKKDWSR
jgi:hypothetical protein